MRLNSSGVWNKKSYLTSPLLVFGRSPGLSGSNGSCWLVLLSGVKNLQPCSTLRREAIASHQKLCFVGHLGTKLGWSSEALTSLHLGTKLGWTSEALTSGPELKETPKNSVIVFSCNKKLRQKISMMNQISKFSTKREPISLILPVGLGSNMALGSLGFHCLFPSPPYFYIVRKGEVWVVEDDSGIRSLLS